MLTYEMNNDEALTFSWMFYSPTVKTAFMEGTSHDHIKRGAFFGIYSFIKEGEYTDQEHPKDLISSNEEITYDPTGILNIKVHNHLDKPETLKLSRLNKNKLKVEMDITIDYIDFDNPRHQKLSIYNYLLSTTEPEPNVNRCNLVPKLPEELQENEYNENEIDC